MSDHRAPLSWMSQDEMRAYNPTWREQAAQWLMNLGPGSAESGYQPSQGRRDFVTGLLGTSGVGQPGLGLLDFVPVVGGLLGGQEAARTGDYTGAAMNVIPGAAAGRTAMRGAVGAAHAGEKAAENFASRNAMIYDPPAKPQRAFEADYKPQDYPLGVPADASGRLTNDIERRPLVAKYIAGHRMVGGDDVAISQEELKPIAEAITGSPLAMVPAGALPRKTVGAYTHVRGADGSERYIRILRSLNERQAPRVLAHEIGHAIDDLAGLIPTDGLMTELKQVYNTLNIGQERTRHLTGPQHMGYRGADIGRELMGEAIRAYKADPNYLKTVAPKTAARIREYANNNPRINRVIQFNSVAAPFGFAGALALLSASNNDR